VEHRGAIRVPNRPNGVVELDSFEDERPTPPLWGVGFEPVQVVTVADSDFGKRGCAGGLWHASGDILTKTGALVGAKSRSMTRFPTDTTGPSRSARPPVVRPIDPTSRRPLP
jgi:hypothetical protein